MTEDQDGLLGGLPTDRRPSVESPHRAAARKKAQTEDTEASGEPYPKASPTPTTEPAALEQLARAGLGLAAATVSTGMKIAGAALGRIAGRD